MKICTLCHKEKPESDFSWKNKNNNKLHSHCKICQNTLIYDYEHNKDYYKKMPQNKIKK